MTQKYLI